LQAIIAPITTCGIWPKSRIDLIGASAMRQAVEALRDVDVGDGTLRVVEAGRGGEVVMLHGWTLDHRNWIPQMPLAAIARLVVPDRRGFGQSSAPADVVREWEDVDHLVARDRFVLVGLSQGGTVALDYARRRPERLAGLVLVGAPLHDAVPHDGAQDVLPRQRYAAMIAAGQLAAMKAEWQQHPLTRTEPAARPLLAAMLDGYDGRDLLAAQAPVMIGADDLAALPMPVLAIAGAWDMPWRRRVAAFIGATAPAGRTISIERAGHLCNLDQPASFNARLRDFILPLLPAKALH
jgi:pimeloyl-ACP methyl ester carboxylesterase